MAKAVTAAFKAAWEAKHGKILLRRVLYRRRFFDEDAGQYDFETAPAVSGVPAGWNLLESRLLVKTGRVKQFLDFPKLNEFRSENVTLRLNNTRNFFVPNLSDHSFFGADLTHPDGFEPFLTRFRIQVGYRLQDGSEEYVDLFTGSLVDMRFNGDRSEVEITLESDARILKDSDAQEVSTAFVDGATVPANADGVTTEFRTVQTGVGRVDKDGVKVNTLPQLQGDYTVSDLNEPDLGALIRFKTAPASGAVTVSGLAWKQNESIEDLVLDLLDHAGITDRTVDEVLFNPGVSGTRTVDSQPQWQATTITNGDVTSSPGTLKQKWMRIDDFTDPDLNTNPFWQRVGNYDASGGQLRVFTTVGGGSSHVATAQPANVGTWRVNLNILFGIAGANPNFQRTGLGIMLQTDHLNAEGYYLSYNPFSGNVEFNRLVSSTITLLGTIRAIPGAGFNEWRVTREAGGTFRFYFNGVLQTINGGPGTTIVDNTFATGTHFGFTAESTSDDTSDIRADDIYFADELDGTSAFPSLPAITTVSQTDFNLLSTPDTAGPLDFVVALNTGSVLIETAWSDDGISFDALQPLGAGNSIAGTPKQYLRVKVTLTQGNNVTRPEIQRYVVNFTVAKIFLRLANFTGKTVFDAIQRLAAAADYEWGFDGSGKFFMRAKATAGSPVVELSQSNGIRAVMDYNLGFDRVITEGQVIYGDGNYFAKFGSAEAGEAAPTTEQRFGKRIRLDNFSDLMFANDVDLGSGRAQALRNENYLPKRRARLMTKLTPHLDPSDPMRWSYFDDPKLYDNIAGDPLNDLGNEWVTAGEAQHVLARDLDSKVVGMIYDPDNNSGECIVQEVLV